MSCYDQNDDATSLQYLVFIMPTMLVTIFTMVIVNVDAAVAVKFIFLVGGRFP